MKYQLVVTGPDNMLQAQNNNFSIPHKLSVLIHQDGLSFYIYNASGIKKQWDEVFDSSKNPSEILKIIEDQEIDQPDSQKSFSQVTLFYHHKLFSLVPNTIFKEKHASDYLKYNAHLLKTDVLSHDKVDQYGAIISYIAYENINNYFFEKYGDFTYLHYSSPLLAHMNVNTDHNTVITVELFNQDFYLTILNKGKMIAHNLFPYQSEEDILYYTMFTIQQHKLDPTEILLKMRGHHVSPTLKEILEIYILNVQLEKDYSKYQEQILCV